MLVLIKIIIEEKIKENNNKNIQKKIFLINTF